MFPPGSGVGAQGPDHLTFDLADASRLSLSFYGKRPGPGMKLDKLSLQFALHETEHADDVLEAYERLIHDAMSGDQTLFTNAEGIERLWEVSHPLLDAPPPRSSSTGSARGVRRPSATSSPRDRGGCPSSADGASTVPTAAVARRPGAVTREPANDGATSSSVVSRASGSGRSSSCT